MTGQNIGYIRVSSEGQNTARQLESIQLDKEFIDKQAWEAPKIAHNSKRALTT